MFKLKPLATVTFLGAILASPSLLAQEEELESTTIEAAAEESAEANLGPVVEIVVTGSRLRSTTYTSISPLQIIDAEFQKEVGLIDAADILQNSTNAGGQQIDLTFNGFVLDNGPGATTVSLRGLGASRTLVLMNGRRLAPSGVEGAPSSPNLGLVPQLMISRYENLLDAASSVYGSDAIAGATNIITRKDFDGLELQVFSDSPNRQGGDANTLAAAWGFNNDKSFFGVGVEYSESERVRYKDRPWTNECTGNVERTESGDIRREDQYYSTVLGYPSLGQCSYFSLASRVLVRGTPYGSIYYTPGYSNGGWPEFTESADPFLGQAADGNGDGVGDINLLDYNLDGSTSDLEADLYPDVKTMNVLAYGETTLDGDMNITPYFEAMYNYLEVNQNSGEGQLFPDVPALNPYNICNPNQPNGVDCGLAYGEYLDNPFIQQAWISQFGAPAWFFRDVLGLDFVGGTATGPSESTPIVSVRGDRNLVDVEQEQLRFVVGATADLPFLDVGTLSNWRGDISFTYNKADGDSARYGVREDRLDLSLGRYSSTNTPCENDLGVALAADTAGCVPVNMYAPSLYPTGNTITGDFATQAERDYLMGNRDFNTIYEQTLISLVLDGDIFEMPGGEMAQLALGVEYRNDDIQSNPNAVARDGLFWGYFKDRGAEGDVTLQEVFAEVQLPLIADQPLLKELTINLAGRLTDHEYYGQNETYSAKVGYRPSEPFLVRATWGTAFKAPNTRELFLQGISGFTTVSDPCYVPEAAIGTLEDGPLAGSYVAERDPRRPEVLANCLATGVDPTIANVGGFNTFSTEVFAIGSFDLEPETSESYSYGFAYEQDFSNKFDLSFGMTYYSVKIENTIIEPSAGFTIADCYGDEAGTGNSVFCGNITRDLSDPTDPRIEFIDLVFINRDQERARGIDYNLSFKDVIDVGVPVDFSLNLTANRNLERSVKFTNADGSVDSDTFQGEWGNPEWRAIGQMRLEWDKWAFNWQTQYLGDVAVDSRLVDPFSNVYGAASIRGETCLGPGAGDENCRDVGSTGSYMRHNVSLFYNEDNWNIGVGVRNLEDKAPPLADPALVLGAKARPIGYGYDVFGRTFFLNAAYNFDLGF